MRNFGTPIGKVVGMVARKTPRSCSFGPFRLDLQRRVLLRDGNPVLLTPKAFSVLTSLVQRADQPVTKEDLLREVWPTSVGTEANLSVNIAAVRRALGDSPRDHRYIVTLPGQGYQFVGGVVWADGAEAVRDVPAVEESVVRVGILPFRVLAPGVDQELYGFGLADAITTELARCDRAVVPGTETVRRFADDSHNPAEVAAALNVDFLLRATVRADGDSLLLNAQLLRREGGIMDWARTYREQPGEPFRVHHEIARDVCRHLELGTNCHHALDIVRQATGNPEAHRLFVEARALISTGDPVSVQRALDLLATVVRLDPDGAEAYAELAKGTWILWLAGAVDSHAAVARVESASGRALDLDSSVAVAHMTLGLADFHYHRDRRSAHAHFLRAIELRPNDAAFYSEYALPMVCEKRCDEGIRSILRARELDPLSPFVIARHSFVLHAARRQQEALAVIEDLLAVYPTRYWGRLLQAMILLAMDAPEGAIDALEVLKQEGTLTPRAAAYHAGALARAGRGKDAASALRGFDSVTSPDGAPHTTRATAFSLAGRREDALDALQKAVEARECTVPFITVLPTWDPLRGDPRFDRLLALIQGDHPFEVE